MDRLITVTRWNREILESVGFADARCVMQGVDTERFRPRPPLGRLGERFVIFSGGKLEFRKGQDIVVVAFRRFAERHPEALLVVAWQNPWPGTAQKIAESPHGTGAPPLDASSGQLNIGAWLMANDLPAGSFFDVRLLSNRAMPDLLREVHVAIFPNRAEGGTNLVAMEAMASGIPCILSANTGHLDLIEPGNCYPLESQRPITGAGRTG